MKAARRLRPRRLFRDFLQSHKKYPRYFSMALQKKKELSFVQNHYRKMPRGKFFLKGRSSSSIIKIYLLLHSKPFRHKNFSDGSINLFFGNFSPSYGFCYHLNHAMHFFRIFPKIKDHIISCFEDINVNFI